MLNPEFEQKIVSLSKAEDQSLMDWSKAKRADNPQAENEAAMRMVAGYREWRAAMKAEGRKFEAECVLAPDDDDDKKVAQLLTAFRRGCMLARLWNDVFRQARIGGCCGVKVGKLIHQPLSEMGRLGDLAALLDDDDPAVRATAAAWLLKQIPERCMPIVEEISKAEWRFSYAGSIACGAVDHYEIDANFRRQVDERLKPNQS